MQKRLLGIAASVAILVSACGGAITSTGPSAPAASTPPAASGSTEPSSSAAAASGSPAPSFDLAADQILKIDLTNEPPTLDPNKAQDSTSIEILHAIHRGLVFFDKDLKVVPALASSWDVSADAKTLTFHLKDGLKYSNGDPIVAGDFVYSMKRTIDPRTAAPYSYVLGEIVGGADLLGLAGKKPAPTDAAIDAALAKLGVTAPDDKTVVVQLAVPATYFLDVMALWIAVPVQQKWITAKNATEAANYVGSGPFMLKKWTHNSEIQLVPNPNWTGQKPTLTEIDATMLNDPATAQANYEAGGLDMVLTPSADLRRVKDDPTLGPEVVDVPALTIGYYTFNFAKGPTANKDFRIALTEAIDKQSLIDTTWGGTGIVANSMVMPGLPGSQPDLNPYPFNLDDAKAHMTTALAALGKTSCADFGKIPFGYNTGADHETRVAFMAQAWTKAFGCQFDQQGMEWKVFLQRRTAGDFIIARDAWGADYPHANNQLNGLFTCGGGNNDSQYCNKDFDALIAKAAAESNQDNQVALYQQAQTLLAGDAPVIWLRFAVARYEVKPYVKNLQITPSDSQLPGDQLMEYIAIAKH
ncbi:MAG: oligopeptide transport system substrate-binding protein [Chloroflexota bacterium]|jgi:oligopeptide transport system substrate-binding protein|nr:oligopeptide transport system substrate-binding protein [Chloroflexota bacterium]